MASRATTRPARCIRLCGGRAAAASRSIARVVADLMSGNDPLLDIEGLGIERLAG